uniref:hypothetical protein n=1 Tax=Stenotrophomonas maltophilia TaxID=40324 RepID=UPI0013D961E2
LPRGSGFDLVERHLLDAGLQPHPANPDPNQDAVNHPVLDADLAAMARAINSEGANPSQFARQQRRRAR